MKKIFLSINILFILLFLTSCSGYGKYLDQPEDTNLEFWITESVSNKDFEKCTFIPGMFGGKLYLDSRYLLVEGDENTIPEVHVLYTVTSYPDYSSRQQCVTSIEITDPEIYVYGLTIDSSANEIAKTMSELGFVEKSENRWYKNNCTFRFEDKQIIIMADITNKLGIVF